MREHLSGYCSLDSSSWLRRSWLQSLGLTFCCWPMTACICVLCQLSPCYYLCSTICLCLSILSLSSISSPCLCLCLSPSLWWLLDSILAAKHCVCVYMLCPLSKNVASCHHQLICHRYLAKIQNCDPLQHPLDTYSFMLDLTNKCMILYLSSAINTPKDLCTPYVNLCILWREAPPLE